MSLFDTSHFIQEIYPLATAAVEPGLRCRVVGELRSLGGFHWAQTIASGIVCTHILGGRGTLVKNGCAHPQDEGMTAFAAARDHIEYFDAPGHPWRYVWAWLEGTKAEEAWKHLTGGDDLPPRRLGLGLGTSLQEALRKAKANDYGEYYSVSLAWGLLDQLSVELKGSGGAVGMSLAQACAAYIEGHLSNNPAVEELAERFKASRVTVFREFRREFGVSPKKYIEGIRFRRAAKLLADVRLDVKEIAHQCGFKDQSHFSCQFKRKFGVPPGQWRSELSSRTPSGNVLAATRPNA